jgi:hypothetical protein
MKDKMWETIADLSAHVQVARYTISIEDTLFSIFCKIRDWAHTFGIHCNYEKYFKILPGKFGDC